MSKIKLSILNILKHTGVLVGALLINAFFGIGIGSTLVQAWGALGFGLMSIFYIFPMILAVSFAVLPTMEFPDLLDEGDSMRGSGLKGTIKLFLLASISSSLIGTAVLMLMVRSTFIWDNLSPLWIILAVYLTYFLIFSWLVYLTRAKTILGKVDTKALALYFLTLGTSVLGIGLVTSFYMSNILVGFGLLVISYGFMLGMSIRVVKNKKIH